MTDEQITIGTNGDVAYSTNEYWGTVPRWVADEIRKDLKAQVEELRDELWIRTGAERHRPSKRTEAKDGE